MSLVAGQGQCTLLELIGVGVDVSTILKEELGHAYKGEGQWVEYGMEYAKIQKKSYATMLSRSLGIV